jgi:hypothetical protein
MDQDIFYQCPPGFPVPGGNQLVTDLKHGADCSKKAEKYLHCYWNLVSVAHF